MNAATKVCLGVSAGLLVASAGGMTAANACPKSDAPACTPAIEAAPPAPEAPLLRVAAPAPGASVVPAVYRPDAPLPPRVVTTSGQGAGAWAFGDDGEASRQVTIVSTEGDETYEVRMNDGEYVVKRNGKKIDDARVRIKEGNVIVLGEDGERVREFKVRPHGHAVGHELKWEGDGGQAIAIHSADAPRMVARVNTPPVMVGIHQSDVPAALRWHLGIDDTPAIMIERVIDGLPADKAGLHAYDVIVSVEGSDGASGTVLSKVLREKKPGDELELYVISKGDKKKVSVELVKYQGSALSIARGGSVGVVPKGEAKFFLDEDRNGFVMDTPDVEFDFAFGDAHDEMEHKIHEELRHKREAIMREFEAQASSGEKDRDAARTALEKALAQLDQNLAERVEMIERQARGAKERAMELRGNRLVLPDRFAERARGLGERHADQLEERLAELEERMADMHNSMEHRMERLMHRMEMMLERAEHELHEWHEDDEE
ncbi:MAG: PDZ domain-containing protein [Phycisphaerales bacterium]